MWAMDTESSTETPDTDKEKKKTGGKGAKRKKYRYSQGFQDSWLDDGLLKYWLSKNVDDGKTFPYCKFCRSK